MKNRKLANIIVYVLLVIGIFLLSHQPVFAESSGPAQWTIDVQTNGNKSAEDPRWTLMEFFAKRVENYTNGRVAMNLHPKNELCSMRTALESVSSGSVQAITPAADYLAGSHPEILFSTIPNVVRDMKNDLLPILDAGVWDIMDKSFEKDNLKLISFFTVGQIICTAAKKGYLKRPEDFKGIKISGPGGVPNEFLKALGVNATRIPGPELYLSLQTGVVDASLTGMTGAIWGDQIYEVAPYVTWYPSAIFGEVCYVFYMNKGIWNKFPKDIKDGILKAGRDAIMQSPEYNYSFLEDIVSKLSVRNVKVERLTSSETSAFLEKVSESLKQWFLKQGGDKAKDILTIVDQYYKGR